MDESAPTLTVTIGPGEGPATVTELQKLADDVQRLANLVSEELFGADAGPCELLVVSAKIASLQLGMVAAPGPQGEETGSEVLTTIVADIEGIGEGKLRHSITPRTLSIYRDIGELAESKRLRFEAAGRVVDIDQGFRNSIRATTRERIAHDTSVTGVIEAVNIHRSPYRFSLYPKLSGFGSIECRFEPEMLGVVVRLMERKSLCRVKGTGHFMAVGIYPTKMEVESPPEELHFEKKKLLSLVGGLDIVPEGTTAEQYLESNRESLGVFETA